VAEPRNVRLCLMKGNVGGGPRLKQRLSRTSLVGGVTRRPAEARSRGKVRVLSSLQKKRSCDRHPARHAANGTVQAAREKFSPAGKSYPHFEKSFAVKFLRLQVRLVNTDRIFDADVGNFKYAHNHWLLSVNTYGALTVRRGLAVKADSRGCAHIFKAIQCKML
jgi:hypothetical protein